MLAPYAWGIYPELDFYANGNELINAELDIDDVLDKLDINAQVHAAGREDAPGFFVDVSFLKMGDNIEVNGRPVIPDGTTDSGIDTELDLDIGGPQIGVAFTF